MSRVPNIQRIYNRIVRKIKNFLLSNDSRQFLIFLFFFLVASGFWLLQTLNDDYETEFTVPVRLRGVPNNVVLTTEPASEVTIKVKDKGTVLLNYLIGKTFFPINLEFSDYTGNNSVKIYTSDFQRTIMSQLNASTQLLSVKPDTLEYIYSTGVARKIPVRVSGGVVANPQYYITDTIYSPDSVLVYAPEELLQTISIAYTEEMDLYNLTDSVSKQVRLKEVRGAKFIPDIVDVRLSVDMYAEKTVEVPLFGVNFPRDKVLRTFPSRVQITFQVGLSNYNKVSASDFVISVSYDELLRLGDEKYTVKLRSVPKEVSHVRVYPQKVDFLIEELPDND